VADPAISTIYSESIAIQSRKVHQIISGDFSPENIHTFQGISAGYLAGSGNDLRLSAVLAGSVHLQVSLLLVPSIIHLLPDATGVVRKNGEKNEAVPV